MDAKGAGFITGNDIDGGTGTDESRAIQIQWADVHPSIESNTIRASARIHTFRHRRTRHDGRTRIREEQHLRHEYLGAALPGSTTGTTQAAVVSTPTSPI